MIGVGRDLGHLSDKQHDPSKVWECDNGTCEQRSEELTRLDLCISCMTPARPGSVGMA